MIHNVKIVTVDLSTTVSVSTMLPGLALAAIVISTTIRVPTINVLHVVISVKGVQALDKINVLNVKTLQLPLSAEYVPVQLVDS